MNSPESMYFLISVLYIVQFAGLINMIICKCIRYMRKHIHIVYIRLFIFTIPSVRFVEHIRHHTQDSDSECDSDIDADNTTERRLLPNNTNRHNRDNNQTDNAETGENNDDESTENDSEYDETDDDEDDDYGSEPEDYRLITSELTHEQRERENAHYYIGLPFLCKIEGLYLMNSTITARTFLAYDYSRVHAYVRNTSAYYVRRNTPIEIMKLYIHEDGLYEVVLKTHWLRIVQRRWKNIYKERQSIIRTRSSIQNQEYFRLYGKYNRGTRNFPSIKGMLIGLAPLLSHDEIEFPYDLPKE